MDVERFSRICMNDISGSECWGMLSVRECVWESCFDGRICRDGINEDSVKFPYYMVIGKHMQYLFFIIEKTLLDHAVTLEFDELMSG